VNKGEKASKEKNDHLVVELTDLTMDIPILSRMLLSFVFSFLLNI